MHEKASIHIRPIKHNSEIHNMRKGAKLDYVFYERTPMNQSKVLHNVSEYRKYLMQLVKEKTNRKMQDKATPIREGVINLSASTKMKDLQKLSNRLEVQFGIKTLQVHIHEDEGRIENDIFIQNRHAHIVFGWINEKTGKSFKLNKAHMVELQDVIADELKMERGVSSNKKHLSALQYKNQQEALKLTKAKEKLATTIDAHNEEQKALLKTKVKHKAENLNGKLKVGGINALATISGSKDRKISTLKQVNQSYEEQFLRLKKGYRQLRVDYETLEEQYEDAKHLNESYEVEFKTLNSEIETIKSKSNQVQNELAKVNKEREFLKEKIEKLQKFKSAIKNLLINALLEKKKDSIEKLWNYTKECLKRKQNAIIKTKQKGKNNDLEIDR